MRADLPRILWAGLLFTCVQGAAGCASGMSPPGRGMNLRYAPREVAGPGLAERPSEELPLTLEARPSSSPEPDAPARRSRRRGSPAVDAAAGPGRAEGVALQSALAAQLAFHGAAGDVSGSMRRIVGELSRLKASHRGIAGKATGLFVRYIDYGERQRRWIDAELVAATRLANTASEVEDPDMQLAMLRLAGPRLEAAMVSSLLLTAWLDLLNLVDVVLKQGFNSAETLFVRMERWRKMMEPAMAALSSQEPGQVEAAAKDAPALMAHLSNEFSSTAEALSMAMKRGERAIQLAQLVEMVTMLSAMRFSLPSLGPATPATLGMGFTVGSNGVLVGTRIVVSAEWVEMVRQLVRAGVLSLPVVSAAVRIQAGQVVMAQAHNELPPGVREALGDGPEVRGMRVTGRAGAGMTESPRHHVLPKEFREWFEKRGFTGEMDIDQFCVRMEQAHHQAIHGGGNWKLGRTWPGEWNRMIMDALNKAETRTGRMLTRNEVLEIVAEHMREHYIPLKFVPW
ncbi:DUF2380 domain-containing protein [Myxococcaceae bacterium GXIMD 01537]